MKKLKFPSLSLSLSGAIAEFCEIFGIVPLKTKKRSFVRGICNNNTVFAVLEFESTRGRLIWTKEKETQKLVFLFPNNGLENRERFNRWVEMPNASMLRKRSIRLVFEPHGSVKEFMWGADDDVIMDEYKQ